MVTDNNMDTSELGGGFNPSPDESEKTYDFEFNASISGYGVVTAKDYDEAKERILSEEYDDILDTWNMKIEEITGVNEQ